MQVIWGLIGLTVAALGLSFLGAMLPLGDSLAVLRAGLCLILLALAVAAQVPRSWRFALLGLGFAGLSTVLWHKVPLSDPGPVTIYQKNMFHANTDLSGLAKDILAVGPDFVTLQEVSVVNGLLLQRLKAAYPHQHLCRSDTRGGVAVLSRIAPVGDGVCAVGFGMARITVDLPNGRHHVAAVHLAWPFPGAQPRQMELLIAELERLDAPFFLGGDFNMVPWSSALSRVARASGTQRAGPALTTFLMGFLPISIDHVFAPDGGA
ncbi:MAG: endonuclease/exonuclease/phosphatase family protein, partial [Pseudomonadota bacterium]